MASLDKIGTVLADTVYNGTDLVAEDVTVNLPEIEFQTSELKAQGTLTIPTPLTGDMEASVTKVGFDKGFFSLLGLESKEIEYRFVQQSISPDGVVTSQGCKAFITGIPKNIPGGTLEPGSTFEGELKFAVTRYQLFVDGAERVLIDKLQNICKINGTDYAKDIKSLL
ncbi:MAG: phage major tail tube protein [Bacteroidales bacterium]|nr:phage major tail tube protein [Bacteroidales bacterium]